VALNDNANNHRRQARTVVPEWVRIDFLFVGDSCGSPYIRFVPEG